MKKLIMFPCVTALAASFMLIVATTSSATASSPFSDDIAQLIDQVAPHQGDVVQVKEIDGQTWEANNGSEVNIPSDPTDPLQLTGGDETKLNIILPQNLGLQSGQVASDGTVVYKSSDSQVDAAIQAMHNGSVRVQTVINTPSAAHEFSYAIGEEFQLVFSEDGSLWAVGLNAAGDFTAFSVGDAWARDANGREVETRYEIRGDALVQVVIPTRDTVYPVVADPQWNWYAAAWGAKFNRAETKGLAAAGGATGICGALAKFSPPLAGACGAAGAYFFTQANIAQSAKKCLFISIVPVPLAMVYKDGDCR
ncbi:hypothetical protein [Lysinibacter sp. HNR]|uniref:hypothetical protein n=1 Tax=Lysinibacter sp. HNR TaxID=3031408 RepID=UPI00243487AB|nr:hypothetical protein [Lysinibacter sp. HNR]WGD37587.1 hypothetical protein FrondiHNR_01285 [Lysinibacter sp. HNR]